MNRDQGSGPSAKVPFLHEKQIEREADLLLDEYALKFAAVTPPPVPVDEIVETHLKLTLVCVTISGMNSQY